MKKSELIQYLQEEPEDYELFITPDEEGNSYAPLYGFEIMLKKGDTFYGIQEVTEDKIRGGKKVIVFNP